MIGAGWEGPGKQEAETALRMMQTTEEEHTLMPECVYTRTGSVMKVCGILCIRVSTPVQGCIHMCCESCMYREENSGMSMTSAVEMPLPNSGHQPDKETEWWDSLPNSSHAVSGRAQALPRPLTACSTHCMRQLQPTETTSSCSPGLRQ